MSIDRRFGKNFSFYHFAKKNITVSYEIHLDKKETSVRARMQESSSGKVDEVMKKFSTYADERSGKINRVGVELSVRNLFYLHIQDRPQLGNELQTLVEERMSGEEIGYKEFLTILAIANRHVEETGLKNAFILIARKNKANNNKQVEELHVDFTAIKSLMKNLIDNGFTDSELDAMVKEADTDGSGTIEIDEFVNYLLGTEEDLANEIKLFSGELPCQSKVDD